MGTMKVVAPVLDTIKRPHMALMILTLVAYSAMAVFPVQKHALAITGAFVCVVAFPFVGHNTTKPVRYIERINALFLMLIFCEVATS
jgi:hypothetical protein